jgi:hypothetical protein
MCSRSPILSSPYQTISANPALPIQLPDHQETRLDKDKMGKARKSASAVKCCCINPCLPCCCCSCKVKKSTLCCWLICLCCVVPIAAPFVVPLIIPLV